MVAYMRRGLKAQKEKRPVAEALSLVGICLRGG
jgi:hypothetical protein